VTNSEDQSFMHIPQLETWESCKYVGIYLALDGNQKSQIEDLQTKCQKMSTVFSPLYWNQKDTEQGFLTIYAPIV
jgi:hypothetical protein